MSNEKRPPLRFWIGLREDGSSRQCMVDFNGDTMDAVKAAWNEQDEKRVMVMETVIEPDLTRGSAAYLELLKRMESCLGDSRLPALDCLLREIAMAAYESGLQNGGRTPKRP